MANTNLGDAKKAKNDEFYTQLEDIEKEIEAYFEYDKDVFRGKTVLLPCDDPEWSNFTRYFAVNFERFGLKKLISTSYAIGSKKVAVETRRILFEEEVEREKNDPQFDLEKIETHGRIFILENDLTGDGKINIDDLHWEYLEGDGDFRSEEVTKLRNEADFIITNPPFSLFREFLAWIVEGNKKFLIIGNKNCVTYKEVFPMIKENKLWAGMTQWAGGLWFETVYDSDVDKVVNGRNMKNVSSVWFTNIEHGRRHRPLQLMTMKDNIKHNRHKEVRGVGYQKYDNYDAIEVPFTDAIPADYYEAIGVPISFLDKYCPDQFEIIGADFELAEPVKLPNGKIGTGRFYVTERERERERERDAIRTEITEKRRLYARIVIRKKKSSES